MVDAFPLYAHSPSGSQNPTGGRAPMPSKAIFNADPAVRDATRDTGLKAKAVRREEMMGVIRKMTKFSLTVDDICQVQPTAQKSRRRDKHFDDEDKKKRKRGILV